MPRRPFTAELQTAGRTGGERQRPPTSNGVDLAEVLTRLDRLEAAVNRLVTASTAGEQPPSDEPPSDEPQPDEPPLDLPSAAPPGVPCEPAASLPMTVPEDSDRVTRTQAEIAALRDTSAGDDPLTAASRELRAVVDATESATEKILGSAETVERAVAHMLSQAVDPVMRVHLDDTQEAVTQIFEAANFQDITGQRVSKVVRALNVVETRLVAIEDLWRPGLVPVVATPVPEVTEDDRHLLNGPQLDNGGMSQDDIDAMFD